MSAPRLRHLERLYRNAAPLTKMSSKTSECSNVSKKLSGVLFLMSKSSFLVKLIGKTLLKGIVHFEIKIWYLSAYPKGIQDVGVFFFFSRSNFDVFRSNRSSLSVI